MRLHVRFAALIADRGKPKPAKVSPGDVAVLQYTGGTTGEPKAAMLTHANLTANSAQMVAFVGELAKPGEQEITLGVLPLFHVFALTSGAQLFDRYWRRDGAAAALRHASRRSPRCRAPGCTTIATAVPTIYGALNNLSDTEFAKLKPRCGDRSRAARRFPSTRASKFETRSGTPRGRGLWPVRGLADHHLQPARQGAQGQ